MTHFEKTWEADEDIAGIVNYTAERWGSLQVRKYMAGLEQRMNELATGLSHARTLDALIEGLQVARYEHHYIFGLKRDHQPMLIIAVLHEKMDLMERLKHRLI